MLELKELRIKGIGRFLEEQVIDFNSLGNLTQVDGQNNNTGGSSGAGKSTVFHALDYLLGISNKPNTVLKCRYSEDSPSVKGIFELDGIPLTISRSKKLLIDLDGKVITGSSEVTEGELDRILAIPRDLFRKILHKRQKEGGFFLQMTPKETSDFLTDCLGHGEIKKKIEKLEAKFKELSEKKISLSNNLESSRSALKATADAIRSLGVAPIKDIDQQTILDLKGKAEKSSEELSTVQNSHKLEMETLNLSRPQLDQKSFDLRQQEIYEKELVEIRAQRQAVFLTEHNRQTEINRNISIKKMELEKLSYQIRTADHVKNEAIKMALEIKKIRESICPTCEQTWVTENAKRAETVHLEKLENFKEQIRLGNVASEQMVSAYADIKTWTDEAVPKIPEGSIELENRDQGLILLISQEKSREKDFANAQHYLNKIKLDQFAEQQKLLTDKQYLTQAQLRGQCDIDRRAFETAVNKLKSYDEARARFETSLASLKAQEASYALKIGDITYNLGNAEKELEMAEELKRAVKSYLSCSFDDALITISDNATKLIRNIPNMANATIQLEGIKETQAGKIKEEVNAVIHMDGEENIDIRSLCGGERTAMDLAIDLSVIDLIETRANKGINVFILDEPFDGLDTVCIEMALDVLKNSNINKKLVIVDHNPEVKQIVESKLTVIRDGATSRVMQS